MDHCLCLVHMTRHDDPVRPLSYLHMKEGRPNKRMEEHNKMGKKAPMTPHKAEMAQEEKPTIQNKPPTTTPHPFPPMAPNPGENTDANRKLQEVYGDTIHQNNGRHLDGGIANDAV